MQRIPSSSSIASASSKPLSITSSQTVKYNDLGQYQRLPQPMNANRNDDLRCKEQSKYQKKIQMYTQSVKDRALPKNISETASFMASASQKHSRKDSQNSNSNNLMNTTFFNAGTNTNSNVINMISSKETFNSNLQNPQMGSYPTLLSNSRIQHSGLIQSTQFRNENNPPTNIPSSTIPEVKQESSQHPSSRDYTYRSQQSTNAPNSGEGTNKFQFYKLQSFSQTPVKQQYKKSEELLQTNIPVENKSQSINEYSFKTYFALSDKTAEPIKSPDTFISKETQDTLSQVKLLTNQSYTFSETHLRPSSSISKPKSFFQTQPFVTENQLTQTISMKNKTEQDENMSDLSLSRIDCQNSLLQSTYLQQNNQKNPLQQSQHSITSSFNFHQPTVVFNDDLHSKKNSLSNNNFLNFISQTVANHQGKQGTSSYSQPIQFQEQKFIKSLIHKLHLINQENQLIGSTDLTLEGSIATASVIPEIPEEKKSHFRRMQNFIQNNQSPQKSNLSRDAIQQQNQSQIVSTNALNNSQINQLEGKTPQQITIIKSNSQSKITPIRSNHSKSMSSANLTQLTKQLSQSSLQYTSISTQQTAPSYDNNFNQVQQTEFSYTQPIEKNALSAVALKKRERISYSLSNLPKHINLNQISKSQVPINESELNTARLQKQQGWGCC